MIVWLLWPLNMWALIGEVHTDQNLHVEPRRSQGTLRYFPLGFDIRWFPPTVTYKTRSIVDLLSIKPATRISPTARENRHGQVAVRMCASRFMQSTNGLIYPMDETPMGKQVHAACLDYRGSLHTHFLSGVARKSNQTPYTQYPLLGYHVDPLLKKGSVFTMDIP